MTMPFAFPSRKREKVLSVVASASWVMWATRSVVQAPVGSLLSIGRGIIHRPFVFNYRI
jgi:hypothetical protein